MEELFREVMSRVNGSLQGRVDAIQVRFPLFIGSHIIRNYD